MYALPFRLLVIDASSWYKGKMLTVLATTATATFFSIHVLHDGTAIRDMFSRHAQYLFHSFLVCR